MSSAWELAESEHWTVYLTEGSSRFGYAIECSDGTQASTGDVLGPADLLRATDLLLWALEDWCAVWEVADAPARLRKIADTALSLAEDCEHRLRKGS